jgi:large subunit ribosomal protein L25
MKTISIEATPRERIGKGGARTARREGRIPGTLYGQGKTISLSVDRRDFARKFIAAHGENVIWDVTLPGEAPLKSIAREIQHDPVSRSMLHVDFQHIDMSKTVHVSVVVHLIGEPEGVRTFGGILEHVSRDLEVSCLPLDIPVSIDVDVSGMQIGDSIHVSDIVTDRFEMISEGERVIAHVASPTVEKTAEEEAAEAVTAAEAADAAAKEDGGES